MAKQKTDVNRSEEIRKMLRADPKMPVKEIAAAMKARGLEVTDNLVYYIKGRMHGRRRRRRKARQVVAKVAATTGREDAVAMILKVKSWADEVGGMRQLKSLVDALIG
jgi:hypothetical protein